MKRRDFLVAGGSGAAMLALGWKLGHRGAPAVPVPVPETPHAELPDVDSPFPSGTGTLSGSQKRQLWELCTTLGARWSMTEITRDDLGRVADLKTQQAPSYLEEYRSALVLYGIRRDRIGPSATVEAMWKGAPLDAAAMHALSLDPSDADSVAWSRELSAHARQFVLAELLRLYLARGGCTHLGLARYPGLMASVEPYRTSSVQPGAQRMR